MDNPGSVQRELQNISNELSDLISAAAEESFQATNEQKERLKALKKRIQTGAKSGKLPDNTEAQTKSEELIYQPCLLNADRYFTLPTNAAQARWLNVLLDVQCSIDTSLTKNSP